MEFTSFEEALKVCMTAAPESEEQDAALEYCLHHAPPDLKEKLRAAFVRSAAEKHDGCGCGHDHCDHD
ncbi:MAG: hypothetical protein AB1413_07215 [Thermodesulfobacteriota bacterium]